MNEQITVDHSQFWQTTGLEETSFTVEARIEGVSETWAEALAMRLAAMGLTVWIKGGNRK